MVKNVIMFNPNDDSSDLQANVALGVKSDSSDST